jgi:ribosomal protein S4
MVSNLLTHKKIKVNGNVVNSGNYILKPGDSISIDVTCNEFINNYIRFRFDNNNTSIVKNKELSDEQIDTFFHLPDHIFNY